MTARRGDLFRTRARDGLVLVVSRGPLNLAGRPLVARVATDERYASLPTAVELPPGEGGVLERSYVLCHELATLRRDELEDEPAGSLPPARLVAVDVALRYALDV